MKLNRKQIKRLIESLLNEEENSLEYENISRLVRNLLFANLRNAEKDVQKLGTDVITLNKIDSVFRSNYHKMGKEHMGGGMSPAFTERAEKGIALIISDAARRNMRNVFKDVDIDAGGPGVIEATQTALKNYPALLALYNANK